MGLGLLLLLRFDVCRALGVEGWPGKALGEAGWFNMHFAVRFGRYFWRGEEGADGMMRWG